MSDNKSKPATKTDLQELATKTELKKLEQKLTGRIDSVETTVKNIAVELAKTQADVREIKYDMATKMATKDDISRIMSAIDAYTAEAISYRNRDALRGRAVMDHTAKLSEHETRLQKLEAK
ncbi:MAG: hypothetical protein FD189_2051 [Elusimicrobia bacterium]|nr:MAG: hypothetical protein FD154_2144 [Elusimicrobiota bacterium]KAF0154143.1 MAG: hypothetical protein FD189_2051 [Elusimicrobiota bacterium]